eukprot:6201266-Pleurochrysis_carterae.AAC.5
MAALSSGDMPLPSSASEAQASAKEAGRPGRAIRREVSYAHRLYQKLDSDKVQLAARNCFSGPAGARCGAAVGDGGALPEAASDVSGEWLGATVADGLEEPVAELPRPSLLVDVCRQPPCGIRKWLPREAVKECEAEGMSLRAAAACINTLYGHYCKDVPCVSYGTVSNYKCSTYDPISHGKTLYIPDEFYKESIAWITAVRGLKFPIFADQVLTMANRSLKGTTYLAKYTQERLDKQWYYNSFVDPLALGTGNQRPIEIERARWATAKSIWTWYDMLAKTLVEAGVASWNPEFDSTAPLGSHKAELIIITEPKRVMSFDESRVELDMTESTKCPQQRMVVDKTAPRTQRLDTLAHKGGLAGTGVGGSTASGHALQSALFILASMHLEDQWMSPSPVSHFVDKMGARIKASFTCNAKGGM